jgi:thiol-disulfide isomerase/thioredoxin
MGMAGIMACLLVVGGCGRAPVPAVSVRLVDHAGVEAERARHAGKVVVLDCWSTSCPPCVKEFPGLVHLQKTFGERVACLSLSFDYEGIGSPEEVVPRVEEFLRQVGAGGIVNLVSREDADALYGKMDLVSVPAVFVWGPDGSLARRFDDDMATRDLGRAFTYEDVTRAVEECLAR